MVDGKVGWSADFLSQRLGAALLRYLAVAHYGRGRGEWVEGEYPSHWQQLVHAITQRHRGEAESVWSLADGGASVDEVARLLQPIITATARETLVRLYPEAERVFGSE